MEVDKISNIPGDIIDKILSQLSIRDAVRTSILSSKWRYKWAALPSLVFDDHVLVSEGLKSVKKKLVNIVDQVLLLHSGPIEKFWLSHHDTEGISDIDRWILFLSRGSVKEIVLEIWEGPGYKLPSSLYLCHNLLNLELYNCVLKPPSKFNGFKSLTSLDLQEITMDQNAFDHMISSSPLIEVLTLLNFGFTEPEIYAPSLSKFFAHLPRIKRLKMETSFLKCLAAGKVPEKLPMPCTELSFLSVEIDFNDIDENLATLCLLRSSPNLQELEMFALREEWSDGTASKDFMEDNRDNCLFNQLQIVKVSDISCLKQELNFIKFLLANSPVLEKMTIKPVDIAEGWWPLKELMKELLRFRRASVQSQIVFVDPYDTEC